ncbi:Coagulation factor IX [Amphibalanus amphitrite]|uniref:Coagulation factor IX n=1 Tax=Amphibalanus amphitrite TaxID=1232801 RepID=A0A6A4V5H9_AMPAM|nr:Coagulation factor IX [Amphibalanus amphitrite]
MRCLAIACCCLLAAAALGKPQAKPDAKSQAKPEEKPQGRPQEEWRKPEPTDDFDATTIPAVPFEMKTLEKNNDLEPLPVNRTGGARAVYEITLATGNYYWTSPNHPNNYPNNYDIGLRLTGSAGQLITISCDPFRLENHDRCVWDYLSINGQRYCGTRTEPTIRSSTQLNVDFHTDSSVTASGFYCLIVVPQPGSLSGCECGIRQNARVVGGEDAARGQFPWQAGLVPRGSTRTFCGGSLINNRYVLTAAHCTVSFSPSEIQVMLGDLRIGTSDVGEQRFSVQQIIEHPLYTSATGSGWDFSLLKLTRTITFTSTVSPVCLPTIRQTYAGAEATASGYGRLGATEPQATTLQFVQLPVWSQTACQSLYGPTLKSTMICAGGYPEGGRSVCNGDSGGPLVSDVSGRSQLIGVVSFGVPCALSYIPDVYARVTEALSWIATNTADAEYCNA